MTQLMVGYGEVGAALAHVLAEKHEAIYLHDPPKGLKALTQETTWSGDGKEETTPMPYTWMHVAYPWHKDFIETTLGYWKEFNPKHTVVHSTVPVGTMDSLSRAGLACLTYSPVRGIHPNLIRYLREFPKWFCSSGVEEAEEVGRLFQSCGM